MVRRHSLKLNLHITLKGTTNREEVLFVSFEDNLFLDEVFVFVARNPGRSCSQSWRVLLVIINFLDDVIGGARTHNVEGLIRLVRRFSRMRHLIKVIVHDFAKINERILLDLDGDR